MAEAIEQNENSYSDMTLEGSALYVELLSSF